jgi:hypothetical protein
MTNMPSSRDLTLLIFTRNNLDRLEPLINSTLWIQDRIAVDMQSTDGTAEKLQDAGFGIHAIQPEVFVDELRNRYLSLPKTPWTLILDSDEFLSEDSEEQIYELIASAEESDVGFSIPRHNYFCGKKLMGSGWYPDHQLRLFRTNQIVYSPGHHVPPKPKEKISNIRVLEAPSCLHIHHANYATIEEFLSRQLHYAKTDVYNSEPKSFNFDDYMLKAINQFNKRSQTRDDGQISYVTGLVMYWDEIVRGLIHWERTGYQGHLSEHIPNQVFLRHEISRQHNDLSDLENVHNEYRNSRSWQITAPLRALNSLVKAVMQIRQSKS